MSQFVVTHDAADDIDEIWRYLAENSGEAHADETLRRLVRAFRDLADLPGMGHKRSDLTSRPLHFFLVEPYLVVYLRSGSPLPILAVLHSSRDTRKLLRDRL